MTRTITLVGARGGQGTSTVAAALATDLACSGPVTLLAHDAVAMAQLLGTPQPLPGGDPVAVVPGLTLAGLEGYPGPVTVIDAGPAALSRPTPDGERYAVVRGPCYLALATLVSLPGLRLDGVILVAEPGRSLDAGDVSAVLDLPVVATVPWNPTVARVIDAGLLAVEAGELPELRALRNWGERTPWRRAVSTGHSIERGAHETSSALRRSVDGTAAQSWEVGL